MTFRWFSDESKRGKEKTISEQMSILFPFQLRGQSFISAEVFGKLKPHGS